MDDKIQEWLTKRGCPPHLVHAGTKGLLESWGQTARELAEGWSVKIEKIVKDLEVRQLLHEMEAGGMLDEHETKELHRIDRMFMNSTSPSDSCVWGDEQAQAHKWTKDVNWWFWRTV